MALRGTHPARPRPPAAFIHARELTMRTAKPAAALLPFRAGSAAFISSSSSNSAEAHQQSPGLVSGNPGTPPPMKVARREVPLPSQEGKSGAVQYALYVERVATSARTGSVGGADVARAHRMD